MKVLVVIFLTLISFSTFAQDAAPADLLAILEENSSKECMLNVDTKELCDCSKSEHRKSDHKCVTANCCFPEAASSTGTTASTSCEATVQGNYSKALKEAQEKGIATGVSDQ